MGCWIALAAAKNYDRGMRAKISPFAIAALLMLAACADRAATGPGPMVSRIPANATPLAGRWTLSSSGASCAMTFGGDPSAAEGTVAPEGGCPGSFFTSRKWAFERDSLVIKDHKDATLAQLSPSGARYDGQAATGQAVSLSR
jgi:hypothetical protein